MAWVRAAWSRLAGLRADPHRAARAIPPALWQATLAHYPFLADRPAADTLRLKQLAELFLQHKEFHGAQGLVISDGMAVAIAAQASLPVLHLGTPAQALRWYDDFVGIVVHPAQVIAPREVTDEAGVVHHYQEVLAGETMAGGPVTLSWQDVADAGVSAAQGYNVVVHEFVHKLDLRNGPADGCPPLPAGFMGTTTPRAAQALWRSTLTAAWQDFRDQVVIAERFGGAPPWLDPYGAAALEEFFAVASEAYLVNRPRFAQELGALVPLFDAFFRPASPAD